MRFRDREDAGRFLAEELVGLSARANVLVLGLPRGGVPVAFEVARRLGAPLDVFVVRKLGVPGHEELAMGAIASGGVRVLNEGVVDELGIPPAMIDAVEAEERGELERREHAYREGRPPAPIKGRTVVLVDDGLATGATMRAAVTAVRKLAPAEVVVAVPVAAEPTCEEIRKTADVVVCPRTPEHFYAVGQWYDDFSQTTDDEVRALLRRASAYTEGSARRDERAA